MFLHQILHLATPAHCQADKYAQTWYTCFTRLVGGSQFLYTFLQRNRHWSRWGSSKKSQKLGLQKKHKRKRWDEGTQCDRRAPTSNWIFIWRNKGLYTWEKELHHMQLGSDDFPFASERLRRANALLASPLDIKILINLPVRVVTGMCKKLYHSESACTCSACNGAPNVRQHCY